ncbi:3-oxoacyl-[acyl-carrier-protein] reductase (3-ketoacyl-acyl carrier protein reductase) [Desulforapulum autotrophicum HRM2]|uniref:3-oxoacyl-[acyl-carrier-protein] reductase (3-ketoacyl-acyl carrier protein reductase) n=1 Tax=Desulforapulum autotrophicum (strain ATCC 43914 / DSM 3382 / VKM B-1955 / HRM2) TaxID=177437 RepID=C0QHF7_DESAH|nr:SDR family oxidoreductase [Desulforapulum autotrophicum]ACN17816.1 3-oxoacyl-[acyl-carrier-protein] reductase (3-ketoacyl-acyl carrier protein reductase) [Desulforapulum autotrophicum HRM2]
MKNDYLPLQGKVTLITGAAGGIGSAISYEFARLGSTVCMCDINDSRELADQIASKGVPNRPFPYACDISEYEQVKEMVQEITADHGGVDLLINNAAVDGCGTKNSFPEMSLENFKKTIDIDLSAAVWLTLLVLPGMREKKSGRVLFTAAPRSSSGVPCPYLAGKSGFISMAKHLSARYDKEGIKTLVLALRHTETPMIRRVIASKGINVEEGLKKMHAHSLTGRMITPREIAKLYAWFAVAEDSEVSSVSLLSDGGITYMR